VTFFPFFSRALLCSAGCVAAWGASGNTGNPFQEAAKPNGDRMDRSWKRYRNPNLGYCLSYPSRWYRGSAFDGSGMFVETGTRRSAKPGGEIDIGPINAETSEDARLQPASLTADTLAEDLQEHLTGLQKFARAERLEIIEQHSLDLQGSKALYAKNRYYDPLERTNWMEEVIFVRHKSGLYRLELQCPPDQIKRFEAVFTYLVNSFEFDCKQ
jgi:hypothetical protein